MRKDVAHEIEAQFGGVASSHFLRIRRMRLNVRDFLPTIEKIKEQNKMRKSKYKYELQKGSKHIICLNPACRKKRSNLMLIQKQGK